MTENKRVVYLLVADPNTFSGAESSILSKVENLAILPINSQSDGGEKIEKSIDGGVLIVPPGQWPAGTLAQLTNFSDLPFIAIVDEGCSLSLVKFWYSLGADLVLDLAVSSSVLVSAVERRRELDRRSTLSQLTKKEIELFDILRRAGSNGVSRSHLSKRVWPDVHVHDKTIDVHVFNLRRKLNGSSYRIEVQNSTLRLVEKSESKFSNDQGR